jgi:predicted RNA-binding protein with PUA-like domain
MRHWLVKQEPEDYSWTDLARDKRTAWTGVRSFPARLNLRAMKLDDLVFFYHSVEEKQIVGITRVVKEAYPDPTATDGDWSCVDLAAEKALNEPIGLAAIKADAILKKMWLVKQTRLSVTPVTQSEFERVLKLSRTQL